MEKKGLNFLIKPEPLWINGNDAVFNSSELQNFNSEQRSLISFKLMPLTASKVKKLKEKHTKIKKKANTNASAIQQIMDRSKLNEKKYSEDMFDYMIQDWKGILENDIPVPCTKANKASFVDMYDALGEAIISTCSMIATRHEELKGNSEKNLSTSQDGSGKEK